MIKVKEGFHRIEGLALCADCRRMLKTGEVAWYSRRPDRWEGCYCLLCLHAKKLLSPVEERMFRSRIAELMIMRP